MTAVRRKHLDALRLLLMLEGIDPNTRNAQGDFPLIVAVRGRNEDAVQLLCCHEAIDINQADLAGVFFFENSNCSFGCGEDS
jgi:ankyrin repeat protein